MNNMSYFQNHNDVNIQTDKVTILSEHSDDDVERYPGVPNSWMKIIKFVNPNTKKLNSQYICQFKGCGFKFDKISNIKDHFRKHN